MNILKKHLSVPVTVINRPRFINIGLILLIIFVSTLSWFLTEYVVYQFNQMDLITQETWISQVRPEAHADIGTGLVGYWKLDDGVGTNATDSSGNSNDGTLINGPTWTTGQIDGALDFDGVDDYVDAGSAVSLDDIETQGGGGFTASTWIYARSYGEVNNGYAVSKGSGNMSGYWRLMFTGPSQYIFFMKDYDGATNLSVYVNYPTTYLNSWKHVAVTWDGSASASNVHFYINGVEATKALTDDGLGNKLSDNSNFFAIGASDNYGTGANTFDGLIDEVRIYNRALSADEVGELYDYTGLTQTCAEAGGTCQTNQCSDYINCASISGICDTGYCCSGTCTTDTTAPTIPQNLSVTAISSSQINLSWTASTDNVAVVGYNVYRDGVLVNSLNSLTYSDTGLSPNTSYTYTVSAYDAIPNESSQSASASATTESPPAPDTEAPTIPQNLSATAISSSQINLSWTASTDNVAVVGYNVYRNGAYANSTPNTTFSDTGLTPETTYTYAVDAYDAVLNTSGQSTSASATTQDSTGNIYYISSSGSASWSECININTPCSISTANANAQAGDTIYLRGGTYSISGTAINPTNTGTEGNVITFSAYNDEEVEFVNTSSLSGAYAVNLNSDTGTIRSYIKIHGMTFTNFNRHLWILRGDYNEISYCTFTGTILDSTAMSWRGSTLYRNATYNHIHHCTFSNYGTYVDENDHGILFEIGIDGSGTDGTAYNLIEYNTFAHGGHHVLGIHGNHNVIRYNNIRNDAWWPISDPTYGNRIMMVQGDLPDSYRNLFEYNRIGYGGETSELDQIGGSGGTWSSPYHIVRRNIFMHCLIYGMYYSAYGMEGGHNLKVYNNIFWHNGHSTTGPLKGNWDDAFSHAVLLPDSETYQYDNVYKNNIFYENKNLRGSTIPIIEWWPEWDEPDLQIISDNWRGGVSGDPKFVDISSTPDPALIATQFDFTLQSDSGAIDIGVFLTTIISSNGSGTQFVVNDAGYFMDGWGIIDGDLIQLEGQTQTVRVTAVDYDNNTITVDTSLTWNLGQGVSLVFSGSAPDIGAYEYISDTPPPVDTTPPTGSISINSASPYTNSQDVTLSLSASDSSGVTEMKVSNSNNFSSVITETYKTVKSWTLSLGDGLKTVYAWFKDTANNWNTSPYTDNITLDTTSPTISNIATSNITTNSANISFNTSESTTSYIAYGLTTSYGSQTETVSNLSSFTFQLLTLSDNTTYHYRIISTDQSGNASQSTDQTFKTTQSATPDTTPPSNIDNLSSSNITQTSVNLSWTSPGDDNNTGIAAGYDIRYSTSNITDSNWDSVTQLTGEPIPQIAGTEQSLYIAVGLSSNTTYYFSIKTSDEVPNWSGLSNILSVTTLKEESTPTPTSGGGGGGAVSDTTPPSNPSEFIATPAEKQITLTWTNPTNSDFVRVKILRKEGSAPTSHNDETATIIYEGTEEEYTDTELDNNQIYHYSIFAYDMKPNYSSILTLSVQPEAGKTSITLPKKEKEKETSSLPYPNGSLLTSPEDDKIYLIVNGQKRWIANLEVFFSYGLTPNTEIIVDASVLNQYPLGEEMTQPSLPEGTLIRGINTYQVYIIQPPYKRHIFNPDIFNMYQHFNWNSIQDVVIETVSSYITSDLYRSDNDYRVYSLEEIDEVNGIARKRHLNITAERFTEQGYNWNQIFMVNQEERDYYETGEDLE